MSGEGTGFLSVVVSGIILAAAAYMVLHAKRGALGSLSTGATGAYGQVASTFRGN